jgi:hypothetical protein
MKFTNVHGFPEPFVRAVTRDTYERGDCDYSVSELISPPRLRHLSKRHDDEIVEDVSNRLWSLDGTITHDILARSGDSDLELFEKRLYAEVGGKKIGGKCDTLVLDAGDLTDYKRCRVWSYIFGKYEWEWQVNFYAFLARENGYKVTSVEIFAMFNDWSRTRSLSSKGYPQTNCIRIPQKLWGHDETRIFMAGRVLAHERAKAMADDEIPVCEPFERWDKPTEYAVMKPGRKSALSVHESEAEAVKAMAIGQTVETRPGKSVRCESYCACASFCSYAKSLKPEAV